VITDIQKHTNIFTIGSHKSRKTRKVKFTAIYNAVFIALLNLVSVLFFLLFFGTEVLQSVDWLQFLLGLLRGSTGLGLALTFGPSAQGQTFPTPPLPAFAPQPQAKGA
jgi:hypothetical protein